MSDQAIKARMHEPRPPDFGRVTEAEIKRELRVLEEAEASMYSHIEQHGYIGDSVAYNLKRMLVSQAQRRVLALVKLHFGACETPPPAPPRKQGGE